MQASCIKRIFRVKIAATVSLDNIYFSCRLKHKNVIVITLPEMNLIKDDKIFMEICPDNS